MATEEARADFSHESEIFKYKDVASGQKFSCGITVEGHVVCWGSPKDFILAAPTGRFKQIAVGDAYACAINEQDIIECWGHDWFGQSTPPEGEYTQIQLSRSQSKTDSGRPCGLRKDGTVVCWGELEYPETPSYKFKAINSGLDEHESCGITSDNITICWGTRWGLRGLVELDASAISVGQHEICWVTPDKRLVCSSRHVSQNDWAAGIGPLSPENFKERATDIQQVSAGGIETCALTTEQRIKCWDRRFRNDTFQYDGEFIKVSSGYEHSCAIRTDGSMKCWGDNLHGQSAPP